MAPHIRTRSGCWTCREAGYKCDEQKPFCGRCIRLKIACKGYEVRFKWKNSTLGPKTGKRPREGRGLASSVSSASADMSAPGSGSLEERAYLVLPKPALTPTTSPTLSLRDKQLMHYWIQRLASLLTVAPPNGKPSLFHSHLTAMASEPGALQSTILSMSATHLALASSDPSWKIQAYRHQQNAIILLQKLIQNPLDMHDEPALATVLMMQVSARLYSEDDAEPQVVNHLVGAKAILASRRTVSAWLSSSSARFLLSLFAYHDILSSISRGTRPLIEHSNDFVGIEDDRGLQEIADVLLVVARISEMQELKKYERVRPGQQSVADGNEALGEELEKALLHLDFSRPGQVSPEACISSHDAVLTAEAFRHAAFIYLYRVWKNIGAPSPHTLYHVERCLSCIEKVPIDSSLVASHLWPLWTAGCEAVDTRHREFVRHRCLEMYRARLFPSWKRIVRDIEEVWAAKDLEQVVGGEDGMTRVDCIQVILKQRGREVELA
ncbi:hypothetical protein EJ04DRAFT_584818 [Polyplosphaeria fusca]|uniref:Zn(2)-C6 fungal-type domain-containing protein n=1 Tax=Polyplosphaeria fusca TaxID=682080 RepID=A0A9P4V064_9PLEO|nr:hypothetical protein EJ04DRAFT_584818 [Polyplosphaeria fusca]